MPLPDPDILNSNMGRSLLSGVAKVGIGMAGAIVSLRWVKGSTKERFLMGFGGCAISFLGTTPVAAWLNMSNAEGLVGFLLGLLGMTIANKVYEVIQSLDASNIISIFRR